MNAEVLNPADIDNIPVKEETRTRIAYESARQSLIPLREALEKLKDEEVISDFSIILTGSAAYELREPTDLDVFVVYKKDKVTVSNTSEDQLNGVEYEYGYNNRFIIPVIAQANNEVVSSSVVKGETQGTDYSPIADMIRNDLSGHRRLLIDGIEVDVQVNNREQFLRILEESGAHTKFRLLGKKGFLYMAYERDDVPDQYRKAVWFLSPLLAAADKKTNSHLKGVIEEYYSKIDNAEAGLSSDEIPDKPRSMIEILDNKFVDYLYSFGWLTREEIETAVSEVITAFEENTDYVHRSNLKLIFGKLVSGIVGQPDIDYSFTKSLKTKVNNYWNTQNFVTNGIELGAQLIAGSNIETSNGQVFKNTDLKFLQEH